MKKEAKGQELTINDLHQMIVGLDRSSFSFLEPDALDTVKILIKELPSPESLPSISDQPEAMEYVRDTIGEIMKIIDYYGTKGPEYKARYKSKTKLPPRHKILDFKRIEPMQNAAKQVKAFVKVSQIADNKGNYKIASDMLKFAKMESLSYDELYQIHSDLQKEGLTEEIAILKEAGIWDKLKGLPEALRTKDMANQLQGILQDLNHYGLKIEKWLRKYPNNEKLREVYNKMDQMAYVGKEVFTLFNEELDRDVQRGEGLQDDTTMFTDQNMYDMYQQKETPNQPAQQTQQPQDDNESWEIQQTNLNANEATVNSVISFLSNETNAVRFLESLGSELKAKIQNIVGNSISNKVLRWLASFDNRDQAILQLRQSNPILKTQI